MTATLVGRTFGRYRLDASLGRGGMAEVYRATDTRLGREVAVKVIRPEHAAEAQLRERFLREAQVVAALHHPHILPVYDFGEEDGVPYLVMPLVAGGTLTDRLSGLPLPLARVATWIAQLAGALDAAHAAGVLHRDVKPGNVLVGSEDRLFLADFGIARLAEATTRLTRTGMVVGTPVYMAPEVAAGRSAGPEADRYALACLAFEMLTGRPPFEGENVLSILHQHASTPPPRLTTRVATLPSDLDLLLERALAKDPAARPPSCRAFAEGLVRHLPTAERAAIQLLETPDETAPTLELRPTRPSPSAVMTAPAEPAPEPRPMATPEGTYAAVRPERRGGRLAIVVAAIAVVAVAGALVWRGREATVATEVQPPPTAGDRAPLGAPSASSALPQKSPEAELEPGAPRAGAPPEEAPETAPPAPSPEEDRPEEDRPQEDRQAAAASRPLLVEPRVEEIRLLLARPARGEYARVEAAARALAAREQSPASADVVTRWAAGGRRLASGDAAGAEAALRALLTDGATASGAPAGLLLAAWSAGDGLDPWEVALAFGDPLRQAGAELDRRLAAAPGDVALGLGRAVVHRLDGEPRQAIAGATAAWGRIGERADGDLRAFVAMVLADAEGALGDEAARLRWYGEAVRAAAESRGPVALRAARIARAAGRDDLGLRFARDACDAGIELACGPAQRERRGLPGRRRRPGG